MRAHTPTEKQTLKKAGKPGHETCCLHKGKEAGSEGPGKGDFEEGDHALGERRVVEYSWQSSPADLLPCGSIQMSWLMKLLGRTGMATESLGGTIFRQI